MCANSNPKRIIKLPEMNAVLGQLCAHVGQTVAREPPEDGEMNEMTLPSRHRIEKNRPGCLRPSTLPWLIAMVPAFHINSKLELITPFPALNEIQLKILSFCKKSNQ